LGHFGSLIWLTITVKFAATAVTHSLAKAWITLKAGFDRFNNDDADASVIT
jgi:hypothetical protein